MGFIVTGRTAVDDLGVGSRTSFSVVRDCLMRCAYQAYIQVTTAVGRIRRCAASGRFHFTQTQKSPSGRMGFFTLFDAWQFPTLAWGDPTLPSALRRFTSEFGMGSGGTTALQPPGKFCLLTRFSPVNLICIRLKICLLKSAKTASAL